MEKKITKAMVLSAIEGYFTEMDETQEINGVTVADIVEYATKTQEQLAAKAAKAKEKQAEKKAVGDELRDIVQAVLTDEYQVIADITAQVDVADITPSKVTARLSQLVKAGIAQKEQVKVGDRKVMGYKLASEVEDAE